MRRIMSGLAAAALAAVAVPAGAAEDPGSARSRAFVHAAAQSDSFELMEANTVLAQTSDPQVRAFAQRMIRDHGATFQTLRTAAARAGMRPPEIDVGDQSRFLAELQSLRGRDFDQAYARQQVLAHTSALTVEQGYARTGDNPALRQAAASAVPVISAHLAMAEQLHARLGGP